MKARASNNVISILKDDRGVILHKHQDIEAELLNIYKWLMGDTTENLPSIDLSVMRQGNRITQRQKKKMCMPVTRAEVKKALFEIDDKKFPNINGFSAYLYKNAWNIIHEDVLKLF
ncbi:hypothetical protein P3S68_016454 [Capsicum galapagoense]